MNPVISYNDFTNFLKWNVRDKEELIPILLIRPVTIRYLNKERIIENFFDYMDARTGEDIQFFLPGYVHYPNTSFKPMLPDWSPRNEDTIAIRISRLGNIHYSNKAFTDFISILEMYSHSFVYRGDTELLFINYEPAKEYSLGKIDFENIHRYNLTHLFDCNTIDYPDDRIRLRNVGIFLEKVIKIMNQPIDKYEIIERIDRSYRNACRGNI